MKKSTLESMVRYLNGESVDVDTLRAEVTAEWEKSTEKARANADLYSQAHDAVLGAMSTTEPMTAKAIYETAKANLPEGFTPNKVQYALLHYWEAEVNRTQVGKDASTYTRKA